MKLKSAFAAIAVTTALTGAALLPETAQAKPCIFGQQNGVTESPSSNSPTAAPATTQVDATTTQIDSTIAQAEANHSNNLGAIGASFVVLGGLLVGGIMLKQRFDRTSEPVVEEPTIEEVTAEVLEDQQPEPLFVASEFAIEIPPEVIQSIQEAKESELTSVR